MKKITLFISLCVFITGCKDPLTNLIEKNGFVALTPPMARGTIGDIYDTADLKNPVLTYSTNESATIMSAAANPVSIPITSGFTTNALTANADIVGKADFELQAYGVKSFKVTFVNPEQYLLQEAPFEEKDYPAIRTNNPDISFDKKYVVTALLQVSSLDYEFYDENGGAISASILTNIIQNKIGGNWDIVESNSLVISEPRFIGYRLGILTPTNYNNTLAYTPGKSSVKVKINDIPLKILKKAAE